MSSCTVIEGQESVGDTLHYRERVRQLPGQLQFQAVLGKGAHGAAVLVTAPRGAPLVVKMLRHERLAEPPAVQRFRRELAAHLRLSQTLQVPRVVRCLGFYDHRDPARIHGRFPYYNHGSLTDFMAAGQTAEPALRVLLDALEGLQALHGHRYLHRDVCPANIFVGDEGGWPRGVLGDLGVGLFLEANTLITEDEVLAERGLRVGHAGFTDPALAATEQGDLHGIGATLYWIISGQCSVPAPTPEGLVLPPRPLCRPGLSDEVHAGASQVLRRLTCADGRQRFGNAMDARAGVAQLVTTAPVVAVAPEPRPPAKAPSRQASSMKMPVRHLRRPLWALRPAVAAAAIIMVTGVGDMAVGHRNTVTSGSVAESVATALAQPEKAALAGQPARRQASGQDADEIAVAGNESGEADRLLALAVAAPPGTDPAAMERQLRSTVDSQPSRGELRLALARVLVARGNQRAATGVLAAAPPSTTYRQEIRQLHELLGGGGRP